MERTNKYAEIVKEQTECIQTIQFWKSELREYLREQNIRVSSHQDITLWAVEHVHLDGVIAKYYQSIDDEKQKLAQICIELMEMCRAESFHEE